jgi:hypothetical protein
VFPEIRRPTITERGTEALEIVTLQEETTGRDTSFVGKLEKEEEDICHDERSVEEDQNVDRRSEVRGSQRQGWRKPKY